jgi:uncharacterized protein YjaZ
MKLLIFLLVIPSLLGTVPNINNHINDFILGGLSRGVNLTEELKEFKIQTGLPKTLGFYANVLGYCDSDNKILYLSKRFFDKESIERQSIIDHELGHCLLGRIHRHQVMVYKNKKMPISVMFPEHGLADYSKYKEKYRDELFDENKQYLLKFMKKKLTALIEKENIDELTKEGESTVDEYLYALEMYLNEDLDTEGNPKPIIEEL